MPWWATLLLGLVVGLIPTAVAARRNRQQDEQSASDQLISMRERALRAERLCEAKDVAIEALDDRLRRAPVFNGLSRFFDSLQTPIFVSTEDDAGTCIYVNKQFCDGLGRAPSDLLGKAWSQWLHPGDRNKTETTEARAHYRPVTNFGNRFQHSDGRWIDLRWDCEAYMMDAGGRKQTICQVAFGKDE